MMEKSDYSEIYCGFSSSLGNFGLDPISLISILEELDFSLMVYSLLFTLCVGWV